MSRLLITGGAGFLGSHTCLLLLQAGHRLVVLDNFANSTVRRASSGWCSWPAAMHVRS